MNIFDTFAQRVLSEAEANNEVFDLKWLKSMLKDKSFHPTRTPGGRRYTVHFTSQKHGLLIKLFHEYRHRWWFCQAFKWTGEPGTYPDPLELDAQEIRKDYFETDREEIGDMVNKMIEKAKKEIGA